jgi:ketosteroid isomerase-like protein
METNRADLKQTITQLYRDYESRDMNRILAALPDDFCFEWASDPRTARFSGICRGKGELVEQLSDIAANFQFNSYRPLNILVDGDSAAAQLQLDLTSLTTGHQFSARIAHFWSFRDGCPIHLVEYMDTALIASESGARSGPSSDGLHLPRV